MNPDFSPRTDTTGQRWLHGIPPPAEHRVADVCLYRLCRQFHAACPPGDGPPLPAELDDLARACLLLAHEHGSRSPDCTTHAMEECLSAVRARFWGDQLPWRLALACCRHNPNGRQGLGELTANLDHHNSSIRLWMLELAWLIRDRLDPDCAVPKLLNNAANTLGHWDAAAGLCRALHRNDDNFWVSADAHEPEDFADQYRQRLKFIRERGLPAFTARFENMELRLRRLIDDAALALPAPEK
jgi:hypothetical protein